MTADYQSPPFPIVAELPVRYTIGEPLKPRPVEWDDEETNQQENNQWFLLHAT